MQKCSDDAVDKEILKTAEEHELRVLSPPPTNTPDVENTTNNPPAPVVITTEPKNQHDKGKSNMLVYLTASYLIREECKIDQNYF